VREVDAREDRDAREALVRAWQDACDAVCARVESRDEILGDLLGRLAEPHRRYHDARHVAACLGIAHAQRAHAQRPAEVALALLFHDAVYTRQPGDEADSASLAIASLSMLGVEPDVVARVAGLIMRTADHEAEGDPDAELVLDADLAILGADDADFDAFERGIREEFSFVDDDAFRRGRAAVLRRFLARPAIFLVPAIRAAREEAARYNLSRALQRLAAG